MDEEDGRLGPPPGHIIGNEAYSARYGTRQQDGFQDPGMLRLLIDVTGGRARQFGASDVLKDASVDFLRRPHILQTQSPAGGPIHFAQFANGWETTIHRHPTFET